MDDTKLLVVLAYSYVRYYKEGESVELYYDYDSKEMM